MAADEEVGARLSLKGQREFVRDADRARESIEDIGDEAARAERRGRGMGAGLGVARKGLGGLASAARIGVTALAAVGTGLAAVSVKSISLAMDAGETASKFNTVFGEMSGEVSKFVEQTNREFGIPTAELQDAAAGFGVFGKAAGVAAEELPDFSTSLTQAGLDLGSFYNRDPSEVFQALRSGLVGEAEPLKQFGILMNQASLDAFALEQGLTKTTSEMSEQEKVALRHAFIMANMGDAQGDLARTSGSLANQWKGLKGRVTEASTAFGTAFLPIAEKVVNELNTKLQPAIAWLQTDFPGIINNAGAFITGAMPRIRDAFSIAAEGPGKLGDAVNVLLGPGLEPIVPVFDKIGAVITDVWTIISEALVPAFKDVSSAVPDVLQPLTSADDILSFLADNAETVRKVIVGLVAAFVTWKTVTLAANAALVAQKAIVFLTTGGLKKYLLQSTIVKGATAAWTGAQWLLNAAMSANPIGLVVIAIMALIAIIVIAWKKSETFRNIVIGAWEAVKSAASATWNWMRTNVFEPIGRFFGETIPEAGGKMVAWFRELPGRISSAVSGLWDGIKDSFRGVINWIIDKWNNLSLTIGGITIDPPGPGSITIPSVTLNTPNIPRLHSGGTTTTGGSAIIRPDEEAVILPPAASVVPLPQGSVPTERLPGGSDGPIVLQLVVDRKVLAEQVYDHTRDKVARR